MDKLIDLVKEMRAAQTAYFKRRDSNILAKCKQLEKEVDEMLANARVEEETYTMCQVVSCGTCKNTFAACSEPICYTSMAWQAQLRGYVRKGYKISTVPISSVVIQLCNCSDDNQLTLFNATDNG